ncbi:ABC transporter permease [Oceanivirga miroungae]|uniref:Binding-protein-dependent transport system inner membrane protein n=1 Tax=Oceanivirga miroungae TaxID=1130046 RepID=A0A6I8M905_9FUSO|nr:ABC transporter permease [Oceanivirga miroungae]VWL85295.1 binding-protein-dependent transport system inner membrane protein [Oceanivirga miroungae]
MKKLRTYGSIILILIAWQLFSNYGLVSKFLLPSPLEVLMAFIKDFKLILYHTKYTMAISFIGIFISISLSLFLSIIMDRFEAVYDVVYPILILTQTIPTIAIAPLLIIWLGFYMKPKIVLVVISTFFPITISLINGYRSVDKDNINLLKAMGASKYQIYKYLKFPSSMSYFFSGLKVSMSYALISAVIAEWLGGYYGLGVYMTRVKKSYELDKMFAIIFFISFLSLVLMYIIDNIEKKVIKN